MTAIAEIDAESIFAEHCDSLKRFSLILVNNRDDADDLVQDTFLKLHHHLGNGKEIRTPLSFLFTTMRNIVYDNYRKRKIELVDTTVDVADDSPSIENQIISEQEFEQLCAAINDLPERMRHVLILRKVYGYSCREISEQLGRSVNTIREQVAQGFNRLRK